MITIERNGWRVSRRLGVGDREHVRSGLLQVYCMYTNQVETQVEAALNAAKKLNKTLRAYINADKLAREEPKVLRNIVMTIMGQARDHDIMEETDLSRKHFDWILGRCDIIIEPLENVSGSINDLKELIIKVWLDSGARDITYGNSANLLEQELRVFHPQYYGDEDRLFDELNK